VFLRHLAETHPDLVARYETMYPRVNGPKAVQARVHQHLADALARHRGAAVSVPTRRSLRAGPEPPAPVPLPPPPRQLGFDVASS